MGLSSKQVSSDRGIDWSQTLLQAQNLELPKSPQVIIKRQQGQNQHQSEPLKCPRCDSTNTKFCYYNNYNKSQPRHFCKACKRHWTKGGTLRNVPVGGGRKNKRLKTSKSSTAHPKNTATSTSTASISKVLNINRANDHPRMAIRTSKQKLNLPLSLGHDQKRISAAAAMHQELIRPPSSALQQNSIISSFNLNDVFFMGSPLSLPLNQGLHFPYPNSSSVPDLTPPSVSAPFQASTDYNYSREAAMDDSTIPTIMHNSTSTAAQPWQVSDISSSSGFDMASCWNWDDMDNFASADLNIPWDDSEINP